MKPSCHFKKAISQLEAVDSTIFSQSMVQHQLHYSYVKDIVEDFVQEILPANFLANDLLYINSLHTKQLIVEPREISEESIGEYLVSE